MPVRLVHSVAIVPVAAVVPVATDQIRRGVVIRAVVELRDGTRPIGEFPLRLGREVEADSGAAAEGGNQPADLVVAGRGPVHPGDRIGRAAHARGAVVVMGTALRQRQGNARCLAVHHRIVLPMRELEHGEPERMVDEHVVGGCPGTRRDECARLDATEQEVRRGEARVIGAARPDDRVAKHASRDAQASHVRLVRPMLTAQDVGAGEVGDTIGVRPGLAHIDDHVERRLHSRELHMEVREARGAGQGAAREVDGETMRTVGDGIEIARDRDVLHRELGLTVVEARRDVIGLGRIAGQDEIDVNRPRERPALANGPLLDRGRRERRNGCGRKNNGQKALLHVQDSLLSERARAPHRR